MAGDDDVGGSGVNKLDQFDPLFLHSSDTSGIPLISFKLEGFENYKVWFAAIKLASHTINKLGFTDGKIARPVEAGFLKEQ